MRLFAWLGLGLILGQAARGAPSNCRLYIVEQYDWGAKRGFYIDLEGSELATLPLILGLADGQQWRFVSRAPGFQFGRRYAIQAVLGSQRATVRLDGQPLFETEFSWQPHNGPLIVNNKPAWANEPGDWLGVVRFVRVGLHRQGATVAEKMFDFAELAARPVALLFFEKGDPQSAELAIQAGDTLTLEAELRFERADLRAYAPFIDRFGQARAADYPEKVRFEEELHKDIAQEDARLAQLPPAADFDPYGGLKTAPWKERPAGFFRIVRREGKFWLVTPEGNPCFYTGICCVPALTWETTPITGREYLFEWLPPKEGIFAGAWSRNAWGIQDGTEYCCFYTANLIRKYGADWQAQATARALKRLRAFGFQGGKWGCGVPLAETPVLHRWGTPSLAGHPDIFDPAIRERLREELRQQIEPRRTDPRVVGWSFGNEYDELIKREEIKKILQMERATPAKRALLEYAQQELYGGDFQRLCEAWKAPAKEWERLLASALAPPAEELERLRLYYQARYHEFIYRTVKTLDPHHLYLGFWIVPGWWESPEDWANTAPYCDVIGYDRYAPTFADERLRQLFAQADKPVLCGEFSHPAWYGGARGFGRYGTYAQDEAEAGRLYQAWVRDAARDPYCVGLIWFLYRDQPLTGRGPGRGEALVYGEHYAFGIVTEQDRLKWPLVLAMREANFQAVRWRLAAASP